MIFADVAAKDGHRSHADRHGEERLTHGCVHRIAERGPLLGGRASGEQLAEIGQQVEGQALPRPGQRDRTDAQDEQHREQGDHHHLRHALDAVLHAGARGEHADGDDDDGVDSHLERVGEHIRKHAGHLRAVGAVEGARGGFHHEGEHPAGHAGIEHHEQVVARKAHPLEVVPFRARRLERVVAARDGFLTGAPGRELHDEHRQREDGQKHQVHEYECRTAVFAGDVGEAPHVAQPDGAARAHQDESEARAEFLAFHRFSSPFHGKAPVARCDGRCVNVARQCSGKRWRALAGTAGARARPARADTIRDQPLPQRCTRRRSPSERLFRAQGFHRVLAAGRA